MKKIIYISLIALLCGCNQQAKQQDSNSGQTDIQPAKEEVAVADTTTYEEMAQYLETQQEAAEPEAAEREAAEREAKLEWIYGTWEYDSSYGNTIIVISEYGVKQYDDGDLTYDGSYTMPYDDIEADLPCEIHYGDTSIPIDYANKRLIAGRNAGFRKVTSSTDVTINKTGSSTPSTPKIYSADSFMNAVSSAQIYNSEGGRLNMKHNGLWIGGNSVSPYAPKVLSFNSVGGVLQYETLDSHTITFMVDFSEKTVIGRVSGGTKNMFFEIR